MPIKTKKLSNPTEKSDGCRILITRYRPQWVRKENENWDEWDRRLAPSRDLHAAWYGRKRENGKVVQRNLPQIPWNEYKECFLKEMESAEAKEAIKSLRERSAKGEIITVLCKCEDESHCHRSLVKKLIEAI